MNIYNLSDTLLQKPPFQMIDRVENLELGISGTGIKAVSSNELYFLGHFPDMPVMPGVLVIESAAQTCATILGKSTEDIPVLVNVDSFTFSKPIIPGDILKINCKKSQKSGNSIFIFEVVITVNNTLCARGILSFMKMPKNNLYKEKK